MQKLLRSWMFVPGSRQRMIDKALALTSVDAIMLDLEDGVAPAEKDPARLLVGQSLARAHQMGPTPARYVRINAIGHQRMQDDLAAVLAPGLEGLLLPKVETAEQIKLVAGLLDARETHCGLEAGGVRLMVAIESPRGLMQAHAIASASPRVIGLMFGAEDFGRELGLPIKREGEASELLYPRSAIALAAAAANVQAVDGVWPNLQDSAGLTRYATQARRLGFTGMSLIHPSQIEAINQVFTPTPDELEHCRQVIAAFEQAQARGDGSIAFGGQLIDLPIVERARRTLTLAG
ncbi:MAG TPA: CoA ester lyase [Candidatus Binataceae bacterium]|nr:CoA ester lyase [Candidatus Binataceae bacterium]